jgi:pimeloyl-ACP methyl ester carboxylesterase
LQKKFPVTDLFKFNHVEVSDGLLWMKPTAGCFAIDLPEGRQNLIWATHAAPAADLLTQKIAGTAWRTKPSWYVVAKDDRVAHPTMQRFCAQRMRATIYEADGGHISMLSNPDLVIEVIREAADAVTASCLR